MCAAEICLCVAVDEASVLSAVGENVLARRTWHLLRAAFRAQPSGISDRTDEIGEGCDLRQQRSRAECDNGAGGKSTRLSAFQVQNRYSGKDGTRN